MRSKKMEKKKAAARAKISIPIQRVLINYQEYAAQHDPIGFMQRIISSDKKVRKDRFKKVVEFTGKEKALMASSRPDRRYPQYYKI